MTAIKYITTECYEQTELFRTHSEFSVMNALNFTAEFVWVLKRRAQQVWLCLANSTADGRNVEHFVGAKQVAVSISLHQNISIFRRLGRKCKRASNTCKAQIVRLHGKWRIVSLDNWSDNTLSETVPISLTDTIFWLGMFSALARQQLSPDKMLAIRSKQTNKQTRLYKTQIHSAICFDTIGSSSGWYLKHTKEVHTSCYGREISI